MALLDVLSPRFAISRGDAEAALRRMVRVFFARAAWETGDHQVAERFARGELYGYAEGEPGPYDERPATIAWRPYEGNAAVLRVEVFTRQFGSHLVDMITIEHQTGRKLQPFDHGFRLERPLPLPEAAHSLASVLGHPVDLAGHLAFRARFRLCQELLSAHTSYKDAPSYHEWLRQALSEQDRLRVMAAHDYMFTKRRGKELVEQMGSDRPALTAGLSTLLQLGGRIPAPDSVALAREMMDHFPPDWDWQTGVYAPLRIPIEQDWLEVDYTAPYGVRAGLPYLPPEQTATGLELILQPDTERPRLEGIYDRQCLTFDAIDEIRRAFGLPPDARYDHYRREALRD